MGTKWTLSEEIALKNAIQRVGVETKSKKASTTENQISINWHEVEERFNLTMKYKPGTVRCRNAISQKGRNLPLYKEMMNAEKERLEALDAEDSGIKDSDTRGSNTRGSNTRGSNDEATN